MMNNVALQKTDDRELFLDDFVPARLSDLSNSVTRSLATIYGLRFGLTAPEWRVLVVLGRCPGLPAVEVAGRTLLDKVAVSRAVTKLIKSGRVERKIDDIDRRRSMLKLSDDGYRLLAELEPMALNFEDRLMGELTGAEVAVFNRVIDKLFVKSHWMDDLSAQ